jgi:hypothetical protein
VIKLLSPNDHSNHNSELSAQRFNKLLAAHAALLEKSVKSSDFDLTMHGHNAAPIARSHDDVTPLLANDFESQSL